MLRCVVSSAELRMCAMPSVSSQTAHSAFLPDSDSRKLPYANEILFQIIGSKKRASSTGWPCQGEGGERSDGRRSTQCQSFAQHDTRLGVHSSVFTYHSC